MIEVTFLHGFTQTSSAWDGVIDSLGSGYDYRVPDLPGHGSSDGLGLSTPDGFVAEAVRLSVRASSPLPEARVLVGYSMGGRLALNFCLSEPGHWDAVLLISTGAGIADSTLRQERMEADLALASRIETRGIAAFDQEWNSLPIWKGDPSSVVEQRSAMLLSQDPAEIAGALRLSGQGSQPAVWDRLQEISIPSYVLHGSRDAAYSEVATRLATELPSCLGADVLEGGHSLPLENPLAVAEAVRRAADGLSHRRQRAGL